MGSCRLCRLRLGITSDRNLGCLRFGGGCCIFVTGLCGLIAFCTLLSARSFDAKDAFGLVPVVTSLFAIFGFLLYPLLVFI